MVGFIRGYGGWGGDMDSSGATALASDVRLGKTFFANNEKKTGTMPEKAAATIRPGTANIQIAGDQYLSGAQTILGDAALLSSNIKNGITIFNVTGSNNVVDTTLSSGAMSSGDLLAGKKGFANGTQISGSLQDKTGSTSSATPSVSGSYLRMAVPVNGVYNTNSVLRSTFSSVADVLGIASYKIVEGYTVCGVTGTGGGSSTSYHYAQTRASRYYGRTNVTITGLSFTPKLVVWQYAGGSASGERTTEQIRLGGYCDQDEGRLISAGGGSGTLEMVVYAKTLTPGTDVYFGDNSIILYNLTTAGKYYYVIVAGEDEY